MYALVSKNLICKVHFYYAIETLPICTYKWATLAWLNIGFSLECECTEKISASIVT